MRCQTVARLPWRARRLKSEIKVLNENLGEIRELAQDALEDAILMGADEAQIRAALHALVDGLLNPYAAKAPSGKAPSGEGHS